MFKKLITVSSGLLIFAASAIPAFAHVIVKPSQVGVAAFQTFDMGVPTEKDTPTVGVRLIMPKGLKGVSPNVKPGWTIDVKKNGNGDDAEVTEIDWSGGSIPPGQRDDFYFSGQVPAQKTTLKWDAYQVYQDGTTISWTHEPTGNPEDDAAPPPHSITQIINDVGQSSSTTNSNNADLLKSINILMYVSSIALILSIISLTLLIVEKRK